MTNKPSHEAKQTRVSESAKKEAKPEQQGQMPDYFEFIRKPIEAIRPKSGALRYAVLAIFAIAIVWLFSNLLSSDLSAIAKFFLSAVLFMLTGEIIRAWMGWDGFFGLIMFKDRSMLGWIDGQAQKRKNLWIVLSDLGLVLGYGLSSYFLLDPKVRQDKPKLIALYAVGITMLLVLNIFLASLAINVLVGILNQSASAGTTEDFGAATSYVRSAMPSDVLFEVEIGGKMMPITPIMLFVLALLIFGGLASITVFSLLSYAIVIVPPIAYKLLNLALSFVGMQSDLTSKVPPPGGAPIIPGVNLPFVEGILALAALLVVHELAHAFLARVAKIKLDSAGIVFFGVLPFGAFVDPDEKELFSAPAHVQNRVIVAGSTANLIACMITFVILLCALIATDSMRLEGWRVVSGPLPAGAIVYSINGEQFYGQNVSSSPGQAVAISTSLGDFERTANENGKVGISMDYVSRSGSGFKFQYKPGFEWMGFILKVLGLIFALNFLVGVINLMPIPLFDGHRLMANAVGNSAAVNAITIIASLAFALNFLPWLFK